VNVEASGIVGSFEWTVISVDATLPDRADVAVAWLEENGYDVAPGSRGLLRPYLEDGLHLLALKLIKGSDAGSIRPLVLTYAADKPMIPIKLTAVAANEDMGVMTWLLSESRGVPQNYLSLELNEAKINWFNPASNYNDVVSSAADEASGQGFVTEYADQTSTLGDVVWSSFDEQQWQQFRSNVYPQFAALFETAYWQWGGWDGFWDAVRMTVTLPEGVAFADFQLCPSCYSSQVQFSPSVFVEALGKNVIEPVRLVQKLLDSRPYVTRLYTTMSAEDMTVDPLFTFNPDLPTVSNVHSGNRIIECNSRITVDEAPWRIELPQGGIIRGAGPVNFSTTWPDATQSQPSNARILRLSDNGAGAVLEDNTAAISSSLEEYNAALPKPGSPGSGIGNGTGGSGANGFTPGGTDNDSSGCAVSPSPASRMGWLASVAAALAWAGRRRRSRARG
jgi:MYXO-CTERM domain-containing protein